MTFLIVGLLLFYGVHLVPSFVKQRSALIDCLGEKPYMVLYALLSLVGAGMMLYGLSQADRLLLWRAPVWGHSVVLGVMLLVFYLFLAADMRSNLKCYIRHPMLLGVVVWSISHLLVNGDFPSVVLFGSLLVYALFAMISANRRGASLQTNQYPMVNHVKVVFAGLVAYALFLLLIHPYLIGVPII